MRQRLININLYQVAGVLLKLFFFCIACLFMIVLVFLPNIVVAFGLTHIPQSLLWPGSQTTFLPTVTTSPSAVSSQDSQSQQLFSVASNDVSVANTIIYGSELFLVLVGLVFTAVSFFGIRELRHIRQLRTDSESHQKQVGALEVQVTNQLNQLDQRSAIEKQTAESHLEKLRLDIEEQSRIFRDRIEHLTRQFESESQQLTKQFEGEREQLTRQFEDESRTFDEQLNKLGKKFEDESQQLTKQFEGVSQGFDKQLIGLSKQYEDESQKFMEAAYRFSQGTSAYRVGDNIHAIEHYNEAYKLQPNNVRVLERLGRAYSNLDKMDTAIAFLQKALQIDPENVPALRSLALCYRYSDKELAIKYLNKSLEINSTGYEAWDFLGLLYRDLERFDDSTAAHEKAFSIQQRPETEFYLSILYALKGDKIRAKLMALAAYEDTLKQEHDQRIRPVWKILIHAGVPILDDHKEEALELLRSLSEYITTKRIYDGIRAHLQFLLEGTDHHEWIPEFMEIVKLKET